MKIICTTVVRAAKQGDIHGGLYVIDIDSEEVLHYAPYEKDFINDNESIDIPILKIRKEVEKEQVGRINDIRKTRDSKSVKDKLRKITSACKSDANLIPLIVEAAESNATLGEIVDSMKEVFGDWNETSII